MHAACDALGQLGLGVTVAAFVKACHQRAAVAGLVVAAAEPGATTRERRVEVVHAQVTRPLLSGISCTYPKLAPQPMRERDLLIGPLEPTNRAYALARIAGVEMCWSYNRQCGTQYLAAMLTNLYCPDDNYLPTNSHVIQALLRRFDEAKLRGDKEVTVCGTSTPRRVFFFSDVMADGSVFLMNLADERFLPLLGSDETATGRFEPLLANISSART